MSERNISAAQRFGALYLEAFRLNHVVKMNTIGTLCLWEPVMNVTWLSCQCVIVTKPQQLLVENNREMSHFAAGVFSSVPSQSCLFVSFQII